MQDSSAFQFIAIDQIHGPPPTHAQPSIKRSWKNLQKESARMASFSPLLFVLRLMALRSPRARVVIARHNLPNSSPFRLASLNWTMQRQWNGNWSNYP